MPSTICQTPPASLAKSPDWVREGTLQPTPMLVQREYGVKTCFKLRTRVPAARSLLCHIEETLSRRPRHSRWKVLID